MKMPTDPALFARRQTLWGEPVTEMTPEADSEAAFVPFEWFDRGESTIPPTEAVQVFPAQPGMTTSNSPTVVWVVTPPEVKTVPTSKADWPLDTNPETPPS